jgi:hypothetical protein
MADVVAERLGAIRRLKELKATPNFLMHGELEKLQHDHPWLLDWDRYVPLKKREATLRETVQKTKEQGIASKADIQANGDLKTLEELEAKYPEFKQAFPLPGGRSRRRRLTRRRRITRKRK